MCLRAQMRPHNMPIAHAIRADATAWWQPRFKLGLRGAGTRHIVMKAPRRGCCERRRCDVGPKTRLLWGALWRHQRQCATPKMQLMWEASTQGWCHQRDAFVAGGVHAATAPPPKWNCCERRWRCTGLETWLLWEVGATSRCASITALHNPAFQKWEMKKKSLTLPIIK